MFLFSFLTQDSDRAAAVARSQHDYQRLEGKLRQALSEVRRKGRKRSSQSVVVVVVVRRGGGGGDRF
jgi:hypothetical protein